jgi:hypothetical protein
MQPDLIRRTTRDPVTPLLDLLFERFPLLLVVGAVLVDPCLQSVDTLLEIGIFGCYDLGVDITCRAGCHLAAERGHRPVDHLFGRLCDLRDQRGTPGLDALADGLQGDVLVVVSVKFADAAGHRPN